MGMFRKKPVVIEARKYAGIANKEEIVAWLCESEAKTRYDTVEILRHGDKEMISWKGGMLAAPGDWIIKSIMGEFYPCKPDIFEATYEAVEE